MSLRRLDVSGVRNLEPVSLRDLGATNIFYGANGGGKTSLLESIHLLGMARSFRSPQIRSVIRHGALECTVFGEMVSAEGSRLGLGVRRGRDGGFQIKVGGRVVRSASELAERIPLQIINAESFALLQGSPADRRQYLDWGVFHVEHAFHGHWQRFQRSIKQRNSLLRRDKISDSELRPWDSELCEAGAAVDEARQRYFAVLQPAFDALVPQLSQGLSGLELRYRRGWDRNSTLAEALAASQESDRSQGFTHVGPQRADVRVLVDGHNAGETLSRGQQKLVVCALKLAQGRLLAEAGGRGSVYLVDDLPAELDADHCRRVAAVLDDLQAQVFVTCVDKKDMVDAWPRASMDSIRMFHVEHGRINPEPR